MCEWVALLSNDKCAGSLARKNGRSWLACRATRERESKAACGCSIRPNGTDRSAVVRGSRLEKVSGLQRREGQPQKRWE